MRGKHVSKCDVPSVNLPINSTISLEIQKSYCQNISQKLTFRQCTWIDLESPGILLCNILRTLQSIKVIAQSLECKVSHIMCLINVNFELYMYPFFSSSELPGGADRGRRGRVPDHSVGGRGAAGCRQHTQHEEQRVSTTSLVYLWFMPPNPSPLSFPPQTAMGE